MSKKYIYRGGTASVKSAEGIKGSLCRDTDGSYFFRCYADDESYTDYELKHFDIDITISPDALACFYEMDEGTLNWLDHDPQTLNLEEA